MIDVDPDDPVNYETEESAEMEFLKELERVDRLILAEENEKKADTAMHSAELKELITRRNNILGGIEAYRNGERSLFDGDGD